MRALTWVLGDDETRGGPFIRLKKMQNNNEATIIDKVKESAKFVASHATHVKVNEVAMAKFVADLNPDEYQSKVEMDTVFPLKFKSLDHEINFTSLIDLLNFGSGFRHNLKEHCGRGAYESICYGVMSMVISDITMDAQFLCSFKIVDAASYFGLPLTAKDSNEPGELYLLAQHLTRAMNEAGLALAKLGYVDFAQFIRDTVQPSAADERPKAVQLVSRLVAEFPPFDDTAVYQGRTVYIIKKAQLLAADLYRRFKSIEPKFFDFCDIAQVTVFSDNVLPAVLRKLGILEIVDSDLVQIIANREDLPRGDQEVELRLCAVYACKKIVDHAKQAGKQMRELDLDYYLWNKGKDPEFRSFERHHTRETYYY